MTTENLDWKRPIICIVLLQCILACFAYVKGCLDPFLATVLPTVIICSLVVVFTVVMESNLTFALVNILLLMLGILLQTILGNQKHIITTCVACVLAGVIVFAMVHIKRKRWSDRLYLYVGIAFNVVVYSILFLFGTSINGSKAWIRIGSISLQLTEITVFIAVYLFAVILASRMTNKEKMLYSVVVLLLNSLGLIFVKEVGSLVVLCGTFVIVSFIYVENRKGLAIIFGSGMLCLVVGAIGAWLLAKSYANGIQNPLTALSADLVNKILHRFQVVLNPAFDPYGLGYQAGLARKTQIMASLFGSPYYFSIPVGSSDYAFISLIGKFGNVGGFVVMGGYLLMYFQAEKIWVNATDKHDKVLVTGLCSALILRALFTIAGCCNLIPLSGLPSPFLSSGGTAMLINLITLLYTLYAGEKEEY